MKNWNIVREELERLLGKFIDLDGFSPNSKITKIVTVATNEKENNFFIGVLPIDGAYESSTVFEGTKDLTWFKYPEEYSNTGVFWLDKNMVINIKDLMYLRQRFSL
ncbi:hypothetical protein [Clostridium tagluense]|nr:hypothetical protein [Clostridium tagluense]